MQKRPKTTKNREQVDVFAAPKRFWLFKGQEELAGIA
jgi:hypothetical protein